MIIIILLLALSGCESVYNASMPEGMTLVEHHYTDWEKLSEHCQGGEACAIVDGNVCTIHLPLAWNGDPFGSLKINGKIKCRKTARF